MKKYLLGAVALVCAIVFNSFREAPKESKGDGYTIYSYFRFLSTATATEPDLENVGNWTYLSDATTPPVPTCGGSSKVCITHVLPAAAGIGGADNASVKQQKFRDFLAAQNGETDESMSASAYIVSNTDSRQP